MNPNQQPPQNTGQGGYPPQPAATPPPSQPTGFGPQPATTYAVDYLDQIAPPPPSAKFLSGAFGKIVVILGVVFVLAISLIIAFGNQKNTASTEAMAIKLENLERVAKDTQKNLKSGKLTALNSRFDSWLTDTDRDAYDLLGKAGVKKTAIDKDATAKAVKSRTDLMTKFNDAKLNAELDRVYAREMSYQAQTIKNSLDDIVKKVPSKQIKDWAREASKNLVPIQKSFAEFTDE
jgi:hypothetical protein